MPRVGVRELKNETSEIIRAVREERAEYVVTHRGQPVAVILPIAEGVGPAEDERIVAASRPNAEFWAQWEALTEEIANQWRSEKSGVELVDEQRR